MVMQQTSTLPTATQLPFLIGALESTQRKPSTPPADACFKSITHGFSAHLSKVSQLIEVALENIAVCKSKETLKNISQIAYRINPGHFIKFHKMFNIFQGNANRKATDKDSIYFAAYADRVWLFIPTNEVVAQGSISLIKKTVGILIKNISDNSVTVQASHISFHSTLIDDDNKYFENQKHARAKYRIYYMNQLKGCQNVAIADVWGRFLTKKGVKQIMFEKLRDGDLTLFMHHHWQQKKNSWLFERNKWHLALDIAQALNDIHLVEIKDEITQTTKKGLLHRDIKFDNVLMDIENLPSKEKKLRQAIICDFDLMCSTTDRDRLKEKCGTLFYFSPETFAYTFSLKNIAKLFNTEDILQLFGNEVDTWGLGCILYYAEFENLPQCILLQRSLQDNIDEVEEEQNKIKVVQNNRDEIAAKIEECYVEIKTTLDNLEFLERLETDEVTLKLVKDKNALLKKRVSNFNLNLIDLQDHLNLTLFPRLEELQKRNRALINEWETEITRMHHEKQAPKEWGKNLSLF